MKLNKFGKNISYKINRCYRFSQNKNPKLEQIPTNKVTYNCKCMQELT